MDSIFKRTGAEDFPDHLKMMISGPPKSGKTTFLGTVPNIVIADTEPHANNLQSVAHKNIPYVTVNATEDLRQLYSVLRDPTLRAKAAEQLGMPAIEAVAIDTLDTLQQIMKTERLKETRQTQFLRDDWGWIKEEMVSILRAFTSLPLHVFFIVHVKTQELGRGEDSRTVVLPGLQGSIAEDIAGMVGYSVLAFRKQEIRPDGSPYTAYWLRAEGDETYAFIGNRAAGRLPDIVDPDFKAILAAAMGGRSQIKTPVQTAPKQEVAQDPGQGESDIPAPVEEQAPSKSPAPAGDDEPMNAVAMGHIKKVYDAVGLPFPEEIVLAMTLGEGRTLVKTWQAVQADHAEGKSKFDSAPAEMVEIMTNFGWIGEEKSEPEPEIVPDVNGTIEQVLAYVGDDLTRVQEAYDIESKRSKPRATLMSALVNKGAKAPISLPEELVTPDPESADDSSADRAETVVKEALGAEVLAVLESDDAPCEECGNPVDDKDIAVLAKGRFQRRLCVEDYLNEIKKSRSAN